MKNIFKLKFNMELQTFFYANIPSKQQEWKDELRDCILRHNRRLLEYYDDPASKTELSRCYSNDMNDAYYYMGYDIEEYYDDADYQYSKAVLECNCLRDYINYLKTLSNTLIKRLENNPERDIIMFLLSSSGSCFPKDLVNVPEFGLYLFHRGQIYRNTAHNRGTKANPDYVFPERFYNIFKVKARNMMGKKLYDFEETAAFLEDSNIEITDDMVRDLRDFYQYYPKSIILVA